jgi:LemA protein
MITYILLGIVSIIVIYLIITFNSFIHFKNKIKSAWSDIDIQLKKRHDLIPQLVKIVKGYANHEKDTLESVTEMRTEAMNSQKITDKSHTENMLSGALKTIFAVSENYPNLKADKNFLQLQTELAEVEDHIQMARRYYNGSVKQFNTKIQTFPNLLVAQVLGYKSENFFELDGDNEREVVDVKF